MLSWCACACRGGRGAGESPACLQTCEGETAAGRWNFGRPDMDLSVGAGAVGPLWERTSRPACLGLTCGLGLGLAGPDNGASVGLRLGLKLGLQKRVIIGPKLGPNKWALSPPKR